jgi:hypothetical protein
MGSHRGVSGAMPVAIGDLLDTLEFASVDGGFGDSSAFLCRQTGEIYLKSGDTDLDELWYTFEAEETERALRGWCEENSIVLKD